ncbi:MAG: metallophosphoesterase family protein [Myxococcales bacterium]|nr:metallophosphoesterase family protein [Myxococcales bacterium]
MSRLAGGLLLTALSLLDLPGAAVGGLWLRAAEASPPRMQKGPYLQNLAPTSMTVMWQLEPPQPARLVLAGPTGERDFEIPAARVAEADLTGLTPATRYRYEVQAGGDTWRGEFATAPEVGARVPFAFMVLGDSRSNAEAHRRVIERVSQEVPDFILGTGDMVDDGARQDQWQTFFDVERELLVDNVYFPSVGNHDRQGRGRSADTYRSYFSVPDNGGDSERYYSFDYANARVLVLDSNSHSFSLTGQTAWIDRELAAARQDARVRHIFVVMHHPPYSISLHGGQRDLRERWTPLFERYGVAAVFSGHDHNYQRAERNGVRYFVTGGAGAPLYPRSPRASAVDKAAVAHFERAYHYLRVAVNGGVINISAVRVDGSIIESTSWKDGPEPQGERERPPLVALGLGAPAGEVPGGGDAAGGADPATLQAAKGSGSASGSMLWIGMLAAASAMLGAVVFVRRSRQDPDRPAR